LASGWGGEGGGWWGGGGGWGLGWGRRWVGGGVGERGCEAGLLGGACRGVGGRRVFRVLCGGVAGERRGSVWVLCYREGGGGV